jgi:hypothetical protein
VSDPNTILNHYAVGAYAEVTDNAAGKAAFNSVTEAGRFIRALLEKYPPLCFGTSCNVSEDFGLIIVDWNVGND